MGIFLYMLPSTIRRVLEGYGRVKRTLFSFSEFLTDVSSILDMSDL